MLHFPVCLEILVRYNTILSSLLPCYAGSTLHPSTEATRITSAGLSSAIQTLKMRKVAASNLQPVNKQHVQHDVNNDKFNTHTCTPSPPLSFLHSAAPSIPKLLLEKQSFSNVAHLKQPTEFDFTCHQWALLLVINWRGFGFKQETHLQSTEVTSGSQAASQSIAGHLLPPEVAYSVLPF